MVYDGGWCWQGAASKHTGVGNGQRHGRVWAKMWIDRCTLMAVTDADGWVPDSKAI
jgi:hypothetical protein